MTARTARSTAKVGDGANSAVSTTTAYTIAMTVRRSRSANPMRGRLASKATLAFGIGAQGLVEILHLEVRPEHRRRPHLGIRDLPQQKVRDAQLAAGADEQVGIRMLRRVQTARDRRLVDRIWCDAFLHQRAHRVDDLGAA